MAHPLKAYLARNDITAAAFAQRINVSPSQMSRLLSGEREPDLALLAKICAKTGRRVTPGAWVKWYAEQKTPAKERA